MSREDSSLLAAQKAWKLEIPIIDDFLYILSLFNVHYFCERMNKKKITCDNNSINQFLKLNNYSINICKRLLQRDFNVKQKNLKVDKQVRTTCMEMIYFNGK